MTAPEERSRMSGDRAILASPPRTASHALLLLERGEASAEGLVQDMLCRNAGPQGEGPAAFLHQDILRP